MVDSVEWWVNLYLSCLGRKIYTGQFLGAKSQTQFPHRWAEMTHSYWLRGGQSVAQLISAKRQAEKRRPSFYVFGVMRSLILETRPPASRADGLKKHYAMGRCLFRLEWKVSPYSYMPLLETEMLRYVKKHVGRNWDVPIVLTLLYAIHSHKYLPNNNPVFDSTDKQ